MDNGVPRANTAVGGEWFVAGGSKVVLLIVNMARDLLLLMDYKRLAALGSGS